MMQLRVKQEKLSPLLKYPGGKDRELVYILPALPEGCAHYYEPFVGGGAVYFAVDAEKYYINDRSAELMRLYRLIKCGDRRFPRALEEIDEGWTRTSALVGRHLGEIAALYEGYRARPDDVSLDDAVYAFVMRNAEEFGGLLPERFRIDLHGFIDAVAAGVENKLRRIYAFGQRSFPLTKEDFDKTVECAFKSAYYTHFRTLYNHAEALGQDEAAAAAVYYFIREFCYSSMFRYNADGKFNVPYGGISYNRKSLKQKCAYFSDPALADQLQKSELGCEDFESFLDRFPPAEDDFMFLDPPYDTEFSTYANNSFGQDDQTRLSRYLKERCKCRFMLVIKKSDLILQLYRKGEETFGNRKIYITQFDKKYFVSFRNRNDRNAEHLMITNYPVEV